MKGFPRCEEAKMKKLPQLTPLKVWAEEVLVTYHTAYRWARTGIIEARQLGSRWYVVGTGLQNTDQEDPVDESD